MKIQNITWHMYGKNSLETTALILHLFGKDIHKMKHKRNDGVKKTEPGNRAEEQGQKGKGSQ